MKNEQIDLLIEKYFEGETTLSEEKRLHRFFQQKNLPTIYEAEKAMYNYFAAEKAKNAPRKTTIRSLIVRWSAVAAVAVLAVALFFQLPQGQMLLSGGSYVVIDGVVYSDPQIVHDQAIKALDAVTNDKHSNSQKSNVDKEAQRMMLEQLNQFGK
ncbi:MAG: hypothetical protein PHV20_06055 [Bacteroidales bacterium]|nr:hypothetical protein [Bacteroidales bacterium]